MVGAAKPDPALFDAALALAACPPVNAVHVGDSLSKDVQGAARAGIAAVLLDRDGDGADAPVRITSLAELPGLI
jgi:putative hydrolase of the HAD superfamily